MAGTSFIVVAGGFTIGNEVTNTVEMIELRLGPDNKPHFWKTGKGIVDLFFIYSKRNFGSKSNQGVQILGN